MSVRSDIEPRGTERRLSYTRRCGWVDWGHARPGAATALKRQIYGEEGRNARLRGVDLLLENRPAYVLTFGESMAGSVLGISMRTTTDHLWVVRKGLSTSVRDQVALGIFLAGSYEFETLQSGFPYSWKTESGFQRRGPRIRSDRLLRRLPRLHRRADARDLRRGQRGGKLSGLGHLYAPRHR